VILAGAWTDRDLHGQPAPTKKFRFGSQQEQVAFLRGLVTGWRSKLAMREKAVQILQDAGIQPRRRVQQALAIGNWAKESIYYVNEPVEIFQTPARTIRSGIGDCDDFTVCIATLCESIGIPTRLVALSVRPQPRGVLAHIGDALIREDTALTHIYPEALPMHEGRRVRVPLDATGDFPVGTDPIAYALRRGRRVRTFVV
jgi:hypothetical protein